MVEIRAATSADAQLVSEFGARTFRNAFAEQNTTDDTEAYLHDSFSAAKQLAEIQNVDWRTLIAEIDGTAVGYVQVCNEKGPECIASRDRCVELRRIYVDKDWHGQRIGEKLLEAAKDAARSLGATTMWLGVWQKNEAAQRFYRRHGFRRVGAKIFQVGADPQRDDVLLCELDADILL